jgi:hypothetical protein
MKKLVVALVLVASLATAHAKPRKHSTAFALSGIGTGASAALMMSAFFFPKDTGELNYPLLYVGMATSVVTPSLGNFYVEHWLNVGMGVRLAAGALGAYAASTMRQDHRCPTLMAETCTELTDNGMIALGIAGIIYVGGAAYDFKALGEQVDAYNAKHSYRFQWAPAVTPSPSGTGALLGVGGTF